ncbi:PREDICTED: uncharacterized protein LOC104810513 [Tarenaya hassleriana]|uniref:uncharacterized protein LOC104810513 n=1 Tax=Tarenaya hassleriana TaxID=28532 RepID=UPI00053C3388|nr:PREDICTED: uncharacterized protein LOC104810513 [Tarenaya hassleriana]
MSATAFTPAMAVEPLRLHRSSSDCRILKPSTKKKTALSTVKFVTIGRNPQCQPGAKRSFQVRASDRRQGQPDDGTGEPHDGAGIQEDLNYLWKLGAGSMAAAAAIKYGSVLLPEITRPNLALALFIIIAPVVISAFLLTRASYSKKP